MKIARDLLVCIMLICAAAALFRAAMLFVALENGANILTKTAAGVDLMRVTLQAQLAGKYGLISELTAAARESRKTIDVVQYTSLTERAKVAAFSDASIRAVNDLDAVAVNAATTVRALQTAVEQVGAVSAAVEGDAHAARPAIDGATQLLSTLNTGSGRVLDRTTSTIEDVQDRVQAIRPIQRNLESTSKHVDGASAEIEETLGYVRDAFRPAKKSFWVRLLDNVTAGAFSIWLHWIPQRVHEVH